jgi:hypothetical protein
VAWDAALALNEVTVGMGFNTTDSVYNTGTYYLVYAQALASPIGMHILSYDGTSYSVVNDIPPAAEKIYLRIVRSNLTYTGFWSLDGTSWASLIQKTVASAFDNVWLFADYTSSSGDPSPIHSFDWIRGASNTQFAEWPR